MRKKVTFFFKRRKALLSNTQTVFMPFFNTIERKEEIEPVYCLFFLVGCFFLFSFSKHTGVSDLLRACRFFLTSLFFFRHHFLSLHITRQCRVLDFRQLSSTTVLGLSYHPFMNNRVCICAFHRCLPIPITATRRSAMLATTSLASLCRR